MAIVDLEEKSKQIMERGAALPLYTCELGVVPEDDVIPEGYIGRIIVPVNAAGKQEFAPGEYMEAVGGIEHLQEVLTENDILWAPLFVGDLGSPTGWPPQARPDYEEHMDLVATIGPVIKAVLEGNQGPELSYRGDGRSATDNTGLCAEFIKHVDALFKPLGVRTVVGAMDRDLLQDCYVNSAQHLKHAVAGCGGAVFCFCGFTMVAGTHWDTSNPPLVRSGEMAAEFRKGHPADKLYRYLSGFEVIADIDIDDPLSHGNDVLMAEAGFRAGVY